MPDTWEQMTFDFKIYVGFDTSAEQIDQDWNKIFNSMPLCGGYHFKNVDLNLPILLFELGDSWKFNIPALWFKS